MGRSDITPGASYTEPALRRALVDFVTALDITDVTLAGESMSATVSLTASTELEGRVPGVVACNQYDYSKASVEPIASPPSTSAEHVSRGSVRWSRGPRTSPSWASLRGGLGDKSKLPDYYLTELRRVGRRRGYPRVAREVYRNVDSMVAARALYVASPRP